ncbi:MAG: hypothetical protein U9Q78_03230 [Chloroflexota bacterium]|nr:hypothetical protein [Chloroflexota bacterium]
MIRKHFDVSPILDRQPMQLHVARCEGPLTVRGWEQAAVEIEAQGPPEDLEAVLEDTTLTDEEQMAILRMVERGQISPDEGEMLLDALEE